MASVGSCHQNFIWVSEHSREWFERCCQFKATQLLEALGRNNTQILFFSTKIQMILIPTDVGLMTLDYYSNWCTSSGKLEHS
jgi:hypothetical protein